MLGISNSTQLTNPPYTHSVTASIGMVQKEKERNPCVIPMKGVKNRAIETTRSARSQTRWEDRAYVSMTIAKHLHA